MQLGEIIRTFSHDVAANEALLALEDIALFAEVRHAADRFHETTGEYAAGSVRRFANLASSEDWLGLMTIIERASDPGRECLKHMVRWSLGRDARPVPPSQSGCSCGGAGGCSDEH